MLDGSLIISWLCIQFRDTQGDLMLLKDPDLNNSQFFTVCANCLNQLSVEMCEKQVYNWLASLNCWQATRDDNIQ